MLDGQYTGKRREEFLNKDETKGEEEKRLPHTGKSGASQWVPEHPRPSTH